MKPRVSTSSVSNSPSSSVSRSRGSVLRALSSWSFNPSPSVSGSFGSVRTGPISCISTLSPISMSSSDQICTKTGMSASGFPSRETVPVTSTAAIDRSVSRSVSRAGTPYTMTAGDAGVVYIETWPSPAITVLSPRLTQPRNSAFCRAVEFAVVVAFGEG